ncbi:MAG: 50S ribosomal protein L11 methyltransferase [Bacteroidota bacterium]
MKVFFEVKLGLDAGGEDKDILIARLSDLGFDGFLEEEDHLLAYCEKDERTANSMKSVLASQGISLIDIREIADENWNASWESAYEPVTISKDLIVRAPFHEAGKDFEYDIIIEPRMSFGTAHHETTAMMLEIILHLEMAGRAVLDMGSGTGVLAILAFKKGAGEIVAIDNDEWAFQNALDNIQLNDANTIKVELGDAGTISSRLFDIIIANINRNILLKDIPEYTRALNKNGTLILSGFYDEDLEVITDKCSSCGLSFISKNMTNRWTAAVFTKN